MQKVFVIGHVGQDAVIKEINGRQFISFSVAETMRRKNARGETIETTTWYDCLMGSSSIVSYVLKGSQVFVSGRTYTELYTGRDGQAHIATKMMVSDMQLLSSSQSAAQRPAAAGQEQPAAAYAAPAARTATVPKAQPPAAYAPPSPQAEAPKMQDDNDDLPF